MQLLEGKIPEEGHMRTTAKPQQSHSKARVREVISVAPEMNETGPVLSGVSMTQEAEPC